MNTTTNPLRFFCSAAISGFALLLAAPVGAQSTATWSGGTSRDWATAANWSPGIPAEGGNVVIADATTNGITLDASHAIGNFQFGTTGTRASGFSFRTLTNVLTLNGGLTATGNFTGVGPQFYGNLTIGQNQTWNIGGEIGSHSADRGVFIREVTDAGGTRTGASSLVMNGNLTKTGTGQLVIAAATISGAGSFIVSEGALKLNAGASSPLIVGGSGNITVNNVAQVFVSRNSGTMDITRPIILNDTAGMVWGGGNTANDSTVASPIAWNGTSHVLNLPVANRYQSSGAWTGDAAVIVTRTGSSTLTLSGDNSGFTGTLNLNGGTTVLGTAFGGNVAVNAGTATIGGAVAGNVAVNGGTANLPATIAGTLSVGTGGAAVGEAAVTGDIVLNGGGFSADPTTPGSLDTAGDLTLAGTNTVSLTANPTSTDPFTVLTYAGTLTGDATNLTLAGGATNYRSFVFDTSMTGVVTLAVGSETRTWNGGAAWDINNSPNWLEGDQKFLQLDSVVFTDTAAGTVMLRGMLIPTSITVSSDKEYIFIPDADGHIAGAATLTKSGTGTFTLAGTNTFTGGIIVEAGTLRANAGAAFGANGQVITVANGATLDHNGAWGVSRDFNAVIAGAGVDGAGVIVNNSASGQQAGFRSLTLTADATIGGINRWDVRPITAGEALVDLAGFTLTKTGTNKISFVDGNLPNDGVININQGTLAFTRMVIGGNGDVNVNPGTTLQFENNATGSFSRPLAIDSGTVLVTGNAFAVGSTVTLANTATIQTDVNLTIANALDGTGALAKTGTAALVLEGDATHTGGTTVNAGTLQIGAGGATGWLAADIANYGTVAFNRSDDVSFTNVITGTGGLAQMGPGTLALETAQTYTGATAVNAGILKLNAGVANTLPTVTAVTLADAAGASLDLNGLDQEVRTLGGGGTTGGTVVNSGASPVVLTIRPTVTDSVTFSGTIGGDTRVVVVGDKLAPSYTAPRQRFAGTASTYTGGTLVDGATLLARADGSLGAVPASFDPMNIILQNNGTLFNDANDFVLTLDANRGITLGTGGGALAAGFNTDVTVQGVITGDAGNNLTIVENRNTVVLTGNNTYAGNTIINGPGTNGTGRLQIGDGGTSGTLGTGDVVNDGQLSFNRSDDTSYDGSISGSGTLTQLGAGVLTLAGPNTYTGNTTVSAGTLVLAEGAGLSFVVTDGGSTQVLGTGALTLNGAFAIDTSTVTVESGSWTLVDTTTLATTVGASFSLAGGEWSETAGVWKKTDGAKNWTFSEATGVLALSGAGYAGWIAAFDFSAFPGADLSPTGDADGDGIANAIEFVIGNLPNQTKVENLPTVAWVTNPPGVPAGDYMKFTFRRSSASVEAGVGSDVQYDVDLAGVWATAVNGTDGVAILEVEDAAIPGHVVEVYIPRSLAADGRLFGRLAVTVP